mmetsp:Transcript_26602/g.82260  ORF Transcript_26602/g.82260 Transcript_26602/m.82260 type:complete len:223 (-) Transcript_26602:3254-3922(-)
MKNKKTRQREGRTGIFPTADQPARYAAHWSPMTSGRLSPATQHTGGWYIVLVGKGSLKKSTSRAGPRPAPAMAAAVAVAAWSQRGSTESCSGAKRSAPPLQLHTGCPRCSRPCRARQRRGPSRSGRTLPGCRRARWRAARVPALPARQAGSRVPREDRMETAPAPTPARDRPGSRHSAPRDDGRCRCCRRCPCPSSPFPSRCCRPHRNRWLLGGAARGLRAA